MPKQTQTTPRRSVAVMTDAEYSAWYAEKERRDKMRIKSALRRAREADQRAQQQLAGSAQP